MIVTGNPVRRDVTEADRQEGYKKLGLDPMKKDPPRLWRVKGSADHQ